MIHNLYNEINEDIWNDFSEYHERWEAYRAMDRGWARLIDDSSPSDFFNENFDDYDEFGTQQCMKRQERLDSVTNLWDDYWSRIGSHPFCEIAEDLHTRTHELIRGFERSYELFETKDPTVAVESYMWLSNRTTVHMVINPFQGKFYIFATLNEIEILKMLPYSNITAYDRTYIKVIENWKWTTIDLLTLPKMKNSRFDEFPSVLVQIDKLMKSNGNGAWCVIPRSLGYGALMAFEHKKDAVLVKMYF